MQIWRGKRGVRQVLTASQHRPVQSVGTIWGHSHSFSRGATTTYSTGQFTQEGRAPLHWDWQQAGGEILKRSSVVRARVSDFGEATLERHWMKRLMLGLLPAAETALRCWLHGQCMEDPLRSPSTRVRDPDRSYKGSIHNARARGLRPSHNQTVWSSWKEELLPHESCSGSRSSRHRIATNETWCHAEWEAGCPHRIKVPSILDRPSTGQV